MNTRSKRLFGLGFMLIVVVIFAGTVQVVEARRTPDWQSALARVVAPNAIVEAAQAQQPMAFPMAPAYQIRDGGAFGYGVAEQQDDAIQLTIALPAAPRTVYCAIVRSPDKLRLFFVNYYTDNLYRSGWVVIDGGAFPPDRALQNQLAAIECHLSGQG